MRAILATVAVLFLSGFATAADEKIDAKKLVGKWEASKDAKASAVIEFDDKGKITVSAMVGETSLKFEGTYKLDGNKLEVTIKLNDKEQKRTLTIKKLTDTEMVTESDGKEETLKRIKAK